MLVRRGITRTFMYNPNEITDEQVPGWSSVRVPGASHPIYSAGGGEEHVISFDLFLDGDRGRFGREGPVRTSRSIAEDIAFYQSLRLPVDYNSLEVALAFPDVVLLTMGIYQGLPCVVKGCPIKMEYFDRNMIPIRATVRMTLGEQPSRSVSASEIFRV